jgi:hypothetical protein
MIYHMTKGHEVYGNMWFGDEHLVEVSRGLKSYKNLLVPLVSFTHSHVDDPRTHIPRVSCNCVHLSTCP